MTTTMMFAIADWHANRAMAAFSAHHKEKNHNKIEELLATFRRHIKLCDLYRGTARRAIWLASLRKR